MMKHSSTPYVQVKAHASNAKVFEKLKMVKSLFSGPLMGLLPKVTPVPWWVAAPSFHFWFTPLQKI